MTLDQVHSAEVFDGSVARSTTSSILQRTHTFIPESSVTYIGSESVCVSFLLRDEAEWNSPELW